MGRESQLYLFPHAYQRTRRFGAVVSHAKLRDGWIPPNEFTILAVYDGLQQRRG
jgi:hypothetical protein